MTEEDIKTAPAEGEQPKAPEQAQTPEQAANDLTRPTNANMRWYIIHAYSGFERKVKESLESRVQAFGLQDKIGRVVIPMETVTQVRNGKKYNMEQLV
jgi:transcriptional antiterminator NusG